MINEIIKVEQHSNDSRIQIVDHDGYVLDLNGSQRIVYQERDGTQVILDVSDDTCILRRSGEWLTTCYFSRDEAWIQVISDEGNLIFEIDCRDMRVQEKRIYIVYDLIQENQVVDTFEYICSW